MSKIQLNPEQQKAVNSIKGKICINAVPGSGKTRVVVNRIANLIDQKVDQNKILAMTFTTKAAGEMELRLNKMGYQCSVGTIHSVCLKIMRSNPKYRNFGVDSTGRLHIELKKIIGYRGMSWKCDLTKVESFISNCYSHLIYPESESINKIYQKSYNGSHLMDCDFEDHESQVGRVRVDDCDFLKRGFEIGDMKKYMEAFIKYHEKMIELELMDFDLMLYLAWISLQDKRFARKWQREFSHVMVDEFQDTNKIQYEIISILAERAESFMVVGDPDQCQPPDTKVQIKKSKYENEEVEISTLGVGQAVRVFNRKACRVTGVRNVIEKQVRFFDGQMIHVGVGDCETRTTPNHRFLVRWTDRTELKWVVYLIMRKDKGYRVGWCQLFNSEKSSHIGMRARLEKADAFWILKVCNSKKDATSVESIISVNFGIPTVMFEPNGELYTDEVIGNIFNSVDSVTNGRTCLQAHGLDSMYPLLPYPQGETKRYRNTVFKVYAINLIPELMSVPLEQGGWTPIESISSKPYSGKVVSLNVAEEHNYVADGIVTCNSIYGFRGAQLQYLLNFQEHANTVITLPLNYRSTVKIADVANELIVKNVERLPSKIVPNRKETGFVGYHVGGGQLAEAIAVVDRIKNVVEKTGASYKDFAVLYRTNAYSQTFEAELLLNEIPYVILGGVDFWKRKEILDIVSYFRFAKTQSSQYLNRIVNVPFRYVNKKQVDTIVDDCENWRVNLLDCDYRGMSQGQKMAMVKLGKDLSHMIKMVDEGRQCSEIYKWLVKEIKYKEYLLRNEGSDSSENSRVQNLDQLEVVMRRCRTVEKFLKYIDDFKKRKKKAKKKDGVRLMTCHRSKGLEFPYVMVVGMNVGLFPHEKSGDIEEERRLFYVAVTRGIEETCVFSANNKPNISQFLYDGNLNVLGEKLERR